MNLTRRALLGLLVGAAALTSAIWRVRRKPRTITLWLTPDSPPWISDRPYLILGIKPTQYGTTVTLQELNQ